MGQHLQADAHIVKLNKFTESEGTVFSSSMVKESSLAILTRQERSQGITIESTQRKFWFNNDVYVYWLNCETNCSKLAVAKFVTSKFQNDNGNRRLMLGYLSAHIQWRAISNVEVWHSYRALRSELVLLSATSHSDFLRRNYSLTVDAIMKLLFSRNQVSLGLDRWTSTNKMAIASLIAYYLDHHWSLGEV